MPFRDKTKFKSPQKILKAESLNNMQDMIHRDITGGPGIRVETFGDRVSIQAATEDVQTGGVQPIPGTLAFFNVESVFGNILNCRRVSVSGISGDLTPVFMSDIFLRDRYDGKSIYYGAGETIKYTYETTIRRQASTDTVSETQEITPPYFSNTNDLESIDQISDKIVAIRLLSPILYINELSETVPAVWQDINTAGRAWAAVQ